MGDEDVTDHPSDDDILLPPPTDAHAIHVTPGGPDDDEENNNMFHLHVGKQGTKEFGRMIGDDAMAQSMVMDDILDEMKMNMDLDGNDDFDAIAQAMAQSKLEMKVNKKGTQEFEQMMGDDAVFQLDRIIKDDHNNKDETDNIIVADNSSDGDVLIGVNNITKSTAGGPLPATDEDDDMSLLKGMETLQ
eukprot:355003_1